jgi:hypothetical protein
LTRFETACEKGECCKVLFKNDLVRDNDFENPRVGGSIPPQATKIQAASSDGSRFRF